MNHANANRKIENAAQRTRCHMKRLHDARLVMLIATCILFLFDCSSHAANISLAKVLEQASHRADFVKPTDDELNKFYETAVDTIAARSPFEVLHERWQNIGWELSETTLNDSRVWIIHHQSMNRRGAGIFAVRPDAEARILLQSPHSFYDKFTRPIVVRAFERSTVRAAAWNSVHRKVQDVAHDERCFFHEFTRAFLTESQRQQQNTFVIQVHGFSQDSRKTTVGSTAEIIVSNGTRFPPNWLRMTAVNLQSVTSGVKLFPTEVSELGATTNVQAQLVNGHDAAFMHVELSEPARRKLRRRSDTVDEFLKCVLDAYRTM
ncbi:MAG: hypothetical protein KDB27_00210 [Planctomycetales bacterium]|nr:hypothetical protein [Planctomycetales bacterium]